MARTRTRKTRGELLCEVLAEGPVDKALKMAPMAEHAGFGADKVRAMCADSSAADIYAFCRQFILDKVPDFEALQS